MKFKEAFMEMPVRKAVVLVVCTVLFLMFIVQTLFVNQVFSIINRNITHFDQLFKQDDKEHNKDLREFDEHYAYDMQMSAHTDEQFHMTNFAPPQERGCYYIRNIKRFEAMQAMAYVKRTEPVRQLVESELKESRDALKVALAKHEFDPALCKPVVL
jgi:hypothetical protein